MRCPQCDCDNDKVIDSRSVRSGLGVRRRRECLACGRRFSTFESVIPEELKVVKRDGSKEEFNRDKLRAGIVNACYKRDISGEDIDLIVGKITSGLLRDFEKEVDSLEIGKRVMEELRELDQVAFVRFASVYRQFQAASDFISEIKGLKK
ncbi:MAG: transcriptional repressor NrdR [Lentisphaeria bacterium]|nr:transcriptional repressor NrdR [Lentisphaeria bacterium]